MADRQIDGPNGVYQLLTDAEMAGHSVGELASQAWVYHRYHLGAHPEMTSNGVRWTGVSRPECDVGQHGVPDCETPEAAVRAAYRVMREGVLSDLEDGIERFREKMEEVAGGHVLYEEA
jgi:hypothetical protein